MSKGVFIGLGVAAFVCLYAVGLRVYRPKIERDLTGRTRTALQKSAIETLDVRFAGRDATVEVKSTPEVAAKAAGVAKNVYGVRVAKGEATENPVAEEREPTAAMTPSLRVQRIGENVTISGELPNAQTKEVFIKAAEELFADAKVTDELVVKEGVSAPAYLQPLAKFIELLAETAPEGFVELTSNELVLGGDVPNTLASQKLEEKARLRLPQGLILAVRLRAAQPVQVTQVESEKRAPAEWRKQVESTRLHFHFDSTTLTPASQAAIEPLVASVKNKNGLKVEITGHADATGSDAYNQSLSERRSRAVARLFMEQGLSESAIETQGRGESDPLAANSSRKGRALNRRVQFQLRGEG